LTTDRKSELKSIKRNSQTEVEQTFCSFEAVKVFRTAPVYEMHFNWFFPKAVLSLLSTKILSDCLNRRSRPSEMFGFELLEFSEVRNGKVTVGVSSAGIRNKNCRCISSREREGNVPDQPKETIVSHNTGR
jgi:hypothetical protein